MAYPAGRHYALGHIRLFPRLYRRIFGGDFCHPLHPNVVDYLSGTMLNAFIFIGVVVGTTLNNRTDFDSFDLVTHFCAGFLAAWFGYEFAMIIQGRYGRLSPALSAMFAICFSLGISVAWEIYEFTMDRLYGMSLQCSEPTSEIGLLDTMTDFIVAAAGGLAGMFLVAFYKNGKIGKNKKAVRARIAREKQEAQIKEQLFEDYLRNQ